MVELSAPYVLAGGGIVVGIIVLLYYSLTAIIPSYSETERKRERWERRSWELGVKWEGMWRLPKEKNEEYEKWEAAVLIPFWKRQKGYKAQIGSNWTVWPENNVCGTALEVHFDSLASLFKAITDEEYEKRVMKQLESFAETIIVKIYIPTDRTPDEIQYRKDGSAGMGRSR